MNYPDCVVYPDNKGQWLLYKDSSCQEVIAFFPDKQDAELVQSLLKRRIEHGKR